MYCSIRDRSQFLINLSDCLRSKWIYKTDLCGLVYYYRPKRSTYEILIMTVGEGKIFPGTSIFGRVMWHVDIRRCAIGILGLWLLARFRETNEVISYNFW